VNDKPGKDNGQFDGPGGIGLDSSDDVYVTDLGNARIQVFAPSK
jgi:NHL repeat